MPQSPPLVREGETFSEAFLRGVSEQPDRIFIDDRSFSRTITWKEAGCFVTHLVHEWESASVGNQILLMGDASWRTVLCVITAHLTGRLVVMADIDNSATYKDRLLEDANLGVIWPDTQGTFEVEPLHDFQLHFSPYEWTEDEIARAFLTSGSTGVPKLLGTEAENIRLGHSPLFERGVKADHFSVLNIRRPSTISYFANLLRAVRSNGTLFLIDLKKHGFVSCEQLLNGAVITELNVTPTMLLQLGVQTDGEWRQKVENVNLSGERLHRVHLETVRTIFPNALIRNNYGMTEVAATCANLVLEPSDPLPNEPVPVGILAKGIQAKILSEDGQVLPTGSTGHLVLMGLPSSVEGSLNSSGEIEFAILHPPDYFETGDIGHLTPDGLLVIEGRTHHMVKVRGERVSLLDVESVIRETGLVAEALAASYTDSNGSAAVGALVVPTDGEVVNLPELRRAILEKHRFVVCPTRIVVVEELPVLAVGKVDRVTATKMLEQVSPGGLSEVYSAVELTLSQLVADALGIQFVAREEDIFSLGADSLSCLQIIHDIEEQLETKIEIAFLLNYPTVIEMASALGAMSPSSGRRISLSSGSEKPVVFWVLPGANPYMALPIARYLSELHHVVLLNLGSLDGDVVLGDYSQMVEALAAAVMDDLPTGEFFIAGFSSACYLANALADSLIVRGVIPSGLVVIDPPTHESVVREYCTSGKICHPIHQVTAREGLLARLAPGTTDLALFGLQLFALSRFQPRVVDVQRLFIGTDRERFNEPHWTPNVYDTVVISDTQHLDFIREPDIVAEALRKWPLLASVAAL